MNVPAIARKSFEELRQQSVFINIVNFVVEHLSRLSSLVVRARLVHEMVDEFNKDVFSHPLVKELSPCKQGCSACCHTQVSVTADEADLLVQRIEAGMAINQNRLRAQMATKDDAREFFKLSYEDRKCIFLDNTGSCSVYDDRPSVCRTNAVLGSADQCKTGDAQGEMRLVKTSKADMVIYAAYLCSKESGSLPNMIGKRLGRND
jgi:uncharacterized protein